MVNRRMLAANAELAEKLLEIAKKHGVSLYNLTNKLISAYIQIEKAGYKDPIDAAIDLIFYNSIVTVGFKLTPPNNASVEELEKLGESLWLITSMKSPGIDPKRAIARLASILFGEKSVFMDQLGNLTRIVVTVPIDSKLKPSEFSSVIKGFMKQAPVKEFNVVQKKSIVLVDIKS